MMDCKANMPGATRMNRGSLYMAPCSEVSGFLVVDRSRSPLQREAQAQALRHIDQPDASLLTGS